MEQCLVKKAAAEALGTFVLVFFAVGTAVITNADVVATALAFGLVIVAMAFSIGRISGCHINPAVSLGVLLSKKMSLKDFLVYVAAQFVGAILGALALFTILRIAVPMSLDLDVWGSNGVISGEMNAGSVAASLLFEIILTFTFVFTILVVTSKKENGKIAGFVIGLTLTLVHLIGIGFTGTSVNPARSFGPALMQAAFGGGGTPMAQVWMFIVGPLAGAVLAAGAFFLFFKYKCSQEEGSEEV